MEIDLSFVTAITGIAVAIVAIVALVIEERRASITLQADLLLKLDERFSGCSMTEKRQTAAAKLLKKEEVNNELDDLLDYFDTIALLLEQKALNPKLAYRTHEYWIIRYWHSSADHIAKSRIRDPESWLTLEWLVNRLELDRVKTGQPKLSSSELERFLKEEASYKL